ncbi:Uncharacterised protein [Mycobacteroides abscessus subsp. abscessus]|nr:Uncharacterised protein [Mycobacteroides abscessus subsp. abscessus]
MPGVFAMLRLDDRTHLIDRRQPVLACGVSAHQPGLALNERK